MYFNLKVEKLKVIELERMNKSIFNLNMLATRCEQSQSFVHMAVVPGSGNLSSIVTMKGRMCDPTPRAQVSTTLSNLLS
jgi:hypothetical protein